MNPAAETRLPWIVTLDPERAWLWIRSVAAGSFGLLLLMVGYLAWAAPDMLWVPPVVILGGLVLAMLLRSELAILTALLVGFSAIVGYRDGFQPEEFIYGAVFLGYLSYWFLSRLFYYRDDILATRVDRALFGFLVWVTLSFVLTFLFRGDPRIMISEWVSVAMLAFHFLIREAGRKSDRALSFIAASLFWVALFVAARNFIDYGSGLASAEALWEIATGRVVQNEHLLMAAGLGSLVVVLYSDRRMVRIIGTSGFLVFITGVVIGQSRALWVSFALGCLVIFLLSDRSRRMRLAWLAVIGLATTFATAALLFPEFFKLIFGGLLNRLFSLESAAAKDVSLISRFVEIGALWPSIRVNPIVGYGFGVPYEYFSLIYQFTMVTSFVHNGPVGVLYKHGLIGFSLLYGFYFASLIRGIRLARRGSGIPRMIGIAVAACLTAEALVGNTENPFATSDKTLLIGVLTGLAAAGMARLESGSEPGSRG